MSENKVMRLSLLISFCLSANLCETDRITILSKIGQCAEKWLGGHIGLHVCCVIS